MGKTKVHPSVRIKQFAHIPNNGLEVKGQSLQCTHCSVDLNCERKSVIQKHLDSTLHKKQQRKHHFNSFHNNAREFYVFQFRDSTFKLKGTKSRCRRLSSGIKRLKKYGRTWCQHLLLQEFRYIYSEIRAFKIGSIQTLSPVAKFHVNLHCANTWMKKAVMT
jgi:hypothetical protein